MFALNRLDGDDNYVIATEDLVSAATSLRAPFTAHDEAAEGTDPGFSGKTTRRRLISSATIASRYRPEESFL